MPAHKIADLLAASSELKALSLQARRLAALQQVLSESVSSTLSQAIRVKNYRAGTLILLADNAAVAAKLRQLAPRLLLHVRKREFEVNGIKVEVQVKNPKIRAENDVTKCALPTDAIKDFKKLADTLPDSHLRSALTRLVARRRTKKSG
jgi:hypothetical protein